MSDWASESVFYHVYPLGLTGAPRRNDRMAEPEPRLRRLLDWVDHIRDLGANALYLGPVFESSSHGYDTADYFHVDRRLGTTDTLREIIGAFHDAGIRVILDAVFNHVGRDFWAFRDVLERGESSPYRGWFADLRFDRRSGYGDPFTYATWHGHENLVKLEVRDPFVREHLFEAARWWLQDLGADGLRLDAADSIDPGFLSMLAGFCRSVRGDAWLLGEAVHGDYRRWANAETLDSVTNYVAYKGLWSSLVDRNYWEIAYTLERQFGPDGDYRGLPLYAFADNHDVDRVATSLGDPGLLRVLYALLVTMPGVPSIYNGSEWGIEGARGADDSGVRPALDAATAPALGRDPELASVIARLARLRRSSPALTRGSYRQLHVAAQQLAFLRERDEERVVVALNSAPEQVTLRLPIAGRAIDLLDVADAFGDGGPLHVTVPPRWVRVLRLC